MQPAAALIRAKRDGHRLSSSELRSVADGLANSWSEGQVAAFAMAVAWRGMDAAECREFTLAMRDSGQRLRWDHLPGPALDKHSTGGVGDGTSLLIAPLLAACGAYVPMISGRGLGHTGGTLDKLESLPGYDAHPSPTTLERVVASVGCAIVGQRDDLVPADRRLYAIRDVTATVDVPELIVASILSKKLAGGATALVLDVKAGSGAQFQHVDDARSLARRLLDAGSSVGLMVDAVLSDMNQVLGSAAGNALEVHEAVQILTGRITAGRLLELSLEIAARLLCLGGVAHGADQAQIRLRRALDSGAAAERFACMIAALGGPTDVLERVDASLPRAPVERIVAARDTGFVTAIDVRALGDVVVALGGGRTKTGQAIDHAVGLSQVCSLGDPVVSGAPLAHVHARADVSADAAVAVVRRAFTVAEAPLPSTPLFTWQPALAEPPWPA